MKRVLLIGAVCTISCVNATVWEGVQTIGRGLRDIGRGTVEVVSAPFKNDTASHEQKDDAQQPANGAQHKNNNKNTSIEGHNAHNMHKNSSDAGSHAQQKSKSAAQNVAG